MDNVKLVLTVLRGQRQTCFDRPSLTVCARVLWTVVRGARYIVRATMVHWHRSAGLGVVCGLCGLSFYTSLLR